MKPFRQISRVQCKQGRDFNSQWYLKPNNSDPLKTVWKINITASLQLHLPILSDLVEEAWFLPVREFTPGKPEDMGFFCHGAHLMEHKGCVKHHKLLVATITIQQIGEIHRTLNPSRQNRQKTKIMGTNTIIPSL